jgi:hypothetical protein
MTAMQICTLCLLDLLITSGCDREVLFAWQLSCVWVLQVYIMAGPNKMMCKWGVRQNVARELTQWYFCGTL